MAFGFWNGMRAIRSLLPRCGGLLREQLDDQLLLHRDLDVFPDRQPAHGAFFLVDVHLEPRRHRPAAGAEIVDDALLHLRGRPELYHLAHPDDVRRHRHLAAVDLDVPVADHLPGLAAGGRHAQAEDHVVQAPLEQLEQVLARHAALALRHGEVAPELSLQDAVDPLGLLLLAQLYAVVRRLRPGEPVLARRVVPTLDGAFLREAARPLQEQLDAFTPALPAGCGSISRHFSLLSYTRRRLGGRHPLCGIGVTSRIALISRPTALRAACSAAGWAANGVLLREPLNPTRPALAQETTLPILSVRVTIVLLKVAWTCAMPTRTSLRSRLRPPLRGAAAAFDSSFSTFSVFSSASSAMYGAPYFFVGGAAAGEAATGFLLTMTPLLLPLRVRAFVWVRWPRTGSPFRCRIPR